MSPLVRAAAAWSWRLLVIVAAAAVTFEILRRLGVVVVPVALALVFTALLLPVVDFLDRYGAVRGGAVAFVIVLGLTILTGVLAFVVSQFAGMLAAICVGRWLWDAKTTDETSCDMPPA